MVKHSRDKSSELIRTLMDSNTNYVPTSMIFNIRKFYDINYTGYCKNIGPKISLLFDLLAGESYERALQLETVDNNTIEFTGSAYSILGLYDKIMNCPDIKVECSMKREEIVPNFITDPVDRFIREKGTSIIKDVSKYTVQFKRIG